MKNTKQERPTEKRLSKEDFERAGINEHYQLKETNNGKPSQ